MSSRRRRYGSKAPGCLCYEEQNKGKSRENGTLYFVTSRGEMPICCLKIREKYWGDWKPQAKHTSLTDISVFRSSSIALLIRIWFR